jgi:Helix-turn-helix domain
MVGERETQCSRILALLIGACGEWVPLPEILGLGIAQYSARIFELRRAGFRIENRTERDPSTGAVHSWFRLPGPPEPASARVAPENPGPSPFERAHAKDREREAERHPLLARVLR